MRQESYDYLKQHYVEIGILCNLSTPKQTHHITMFCVENLYVKVNMYNPK